MKHHHRLLMLAALVLTLAGVLYAQSMTPLVPGIDASTWSELAAMVAVLGGVFALFHWIIARAIIQPQIQASVKLATKEIMSACLEQFTSKYAFIIHEKEEALRHQAVSEAIQQIVEDNDTDNKRLTDVRERVRVLESFRRS